MKVVLRTPVVVLLVVLVAALVVVADIGRRGLSTRTTPSPMEAALARSMRYLATPGELRGRENPVAYSPEVRATAMEHFADHCATCHANDGSGATDLGRSFYPPAPDMRADATQRLSDGEIFSIIENGIRLTGMPAWGNGTPEGERDSWALVHFIRSLGSLTPDDLARMQELNPRSRQELRAEEEARRFLAGEDAAPSTPPATDHAEGGH